MQWLFFLEGMPTLVLALAMWRLLPDSPEQSEPAQPAPLEPLPCSACTAQQLCSELCSAQRAQLSSALTPRCVCVRACLVVRLGQPSRLPSLQAHARASPHTDMLELGFLTLTLT